MSSRARSDERRATSNGGLRPRVLGSLERACASVNLKLKLNLRFVVAATLLMQACASQPANDVGVAQMTGQQQAKRKVVFIAGTRSHGYGQHEHNAGSLLLGRLLTEHHKGIDVVVHQNGWPADSNALDGADAVVIFANGGMGNPARTQLPALSRAMERGAGLVLLHYAVEIPADSGGKEFIDWAGGHFAINWSVNPVWTMQSNPFPTHPITRGLSPYTIEDEWY